MENWLKQSSDKPLYPDVIWSRPENKNGAGKLLIIGGSAGNFVHLARAYEQAEKSGAGTIHLLVPESLRSVTKHIPFINYAPANPSGGFGRQALAEILDTAKNVDGILLAGDMGKNSETSLLLDDLLAKYAGPILVSEEALGSFNSLVSLASLENLFICLNHSALRDLFISAKSEHAVTSAIQKPNLVKALKDFTSKHKATLIIDFNNIWMAKNGNVAETEGASYSPAKSAVWLIQQPEKAFQAIVSSTI